MLILFLKLGLLVMLWMIIWEDFRDREVHLLWFLGTWICGIGLGVWEYGTTEVLEFGIWNLGFVAIQLMLLTIWFWLKKKKFEHIGNRYLGWGDVVFFVVLAFLMPTQSFLIFYTGSLLIVLIGFLIFNTLWSQKVSTIPLAGGMAMCLILVLLGNWCLEYVLIFAN